MFPSKVYQSDKTKLISIQEIDKKAQKLIDKFSREDFKPQIIIGITRGGAVLGRLLAKKLNCDFESFPIYHGQVQKDFRFKKLKPTHKKILLVDDNTNRGYTLKAAFFRVIERLNPKINEDRAFEISIETIVDNLIKGEDEPSGLIYKRNWALQRSLLAEFFSLKEANEMIDNLVKSGLRQISMNSMIEVTDKNGVIDIDIKNLKIIKNREDVTKFKGLLENKKRKSPNSKSIIAHLEKTNINHHWALTGIFREIDIRSCTFFDQLDSDFHVNYSLKWKKTHPVLPWSNKGIADVPKVVENLIKSDVDWKNEVIDEIKNQYSIIRDPFSDFFLTYPFEKALGKAGEEVDYVGFDYTFTVKGDREKVINSFYSWCEENGHEFSRKSNNKGWFSPDVKLVKDHMDYSFTDYGETFRLTIKANNPRSIRSYDGCPKQNHCHKSEVVLDSECSLCNHFKRSFYSLFDESRVGFFTWLEKNGTIKDVNCRVYYADKTRVISKERLLELKKKFKN